MRSNSKDPTKDYERLQRETFSGGEASSIAYVTGQRNCILHGLESPNISFGDTLAGKGWSPSPNGCDFWISEVPVYPGRIGIDSEGKHQDPGFTGYVLYCGQDAVAVIGAKAEGYA